MNSKDERIKFDTYYESFFGAKLFRWLDWKKVKIILKQLPKDKRIIKILDLGCGSAGISSLIQQKNRTLNIIGADHNDKLLKIAESRGIKTKLVDFDNPLPFPNDSFDVVLMIDTIEHVECRKDTLAEAKRIIKSNGKMIIFTPPYDTLTWLVGEYLHNKITRRNSDHISPFTKESLSWILTSTFNNVKIGRANFGLTMYGIASGKK